MKKTLLGLLAGAALLVVGCRAYDDSALAGRVDQLEQKVEKLRSDLDGQIEALKKLTDAKVDGLTIVSVTPVTKDGKEVGFTIKFSDNTVYTITTGDKGDKGDPGDPGKPGDPGTAPTLTVELVDGVYYWKVGDSFLTDASGNKIPATGADGKTPQFRINEEKGVWEISWDGTNWAECGPAVTTASAIFSAVLDDTPEGYVTFVLSDGVTKIVLPKEVPFGLVFEKVKGIGIDAGQTQVISYTVAGADEQTVVDAIAGGNYDVVVLPTDFTAGALQVTAPDPIVPGRVLVWADNGKGKTSIKALTFEGGVAPTYEMVVGDVDAVEPAGENIEIAVTTNMLYNVEIEEKAKDWIRLVETKAIDTKVLVFDVDPNNTGEDRTGMVELIGADGAVLQTIYFFQKAIVMPTLKEFAAEFIKGLEVWENTVGNVDADGTHCAANGTAWENVHFIPIRHSHADYGNEGNQYDPKYDIWTLNINGVEYTSAQAWEIAIRGLMDMVTAEGQLFLDDMTDRNKAFTLQDNAPFATTKIANVPASHDWGKNPWYEYDMTVKDNGEEITAVDVQFMTKVGAWHVVRSFIPAGANSPLGAIGNFQEFGTTSGTLNLGNYVGLIAPMRELLVLMRMYKYLLDNNIDENVYTAIKDQKFDFDLYGLNLNPQPEEFKLNRVWTKSYLDNPTWDADLGVTRTDWNRNGTISGSYIYLPVVNNKEIGIYDLAGNFAGKISGFSGGGTFTVDAIAALGDAVYVASCGGDSQWVNGDLTIYKLTGKDANGMFTSFEVAAVYPRAEMTAGVRYGDKMTAYGTDAEGVLMFVNYSAYDAANQCRENLQFHVQNGVVDPAPIKAQYLVTNDGSPMAGIYILESGADGTQYALYASNQADTRAIALDKWLGTSGWWNYGLLPNGEYGKLPAFETPVLDPRLLTVGGKDYLLYVVANSNAEGVYAYLNVVEIPEVDGNILTRIATITDVDAVSTKYGIVSEEDPLARAGHGGSNTTGYCEISVVDGVAYVLAGADVAGMALFSFGTPAEPTTGSVTGPGDATIVPGGDF